jgi:hypothetical protein
LFISVTQKIIFAEYSIKVFRPIEGSFENLSAGSYPSIVSKKFQEYFD